MLLSYEDNMFRKTSLFVLFMICLPLIPCKRLLADPLLVA